MQRAARDAVRSCERGMGPPVQAQPLPLMMLGGLPGGVPPWTPGGPANPRNAMVVGSWFLLREVEVSTARAAHVTVTGTGERPGAVATVTLPVSKTDAQALGTTRSHRCACLGSASPGCPVHSLLDQLGWLQDAFPRSFLRGKPSLDLPLFPRPDGTVVEKPAMVQTIEAAGRHLGVEPPPDGSERISGQTLRVTGAQGLTALGWRADAVQLMGRWQSHRVQLYTRLAPLSAPGGPAPGGRS